MGGIVNPNTTALILIGFQNDYFAEDGILHPIIEEASRKTGVLKNTLSLIRALRSTEALILTTPIHFTHDYSELVDPVGILANIKELGAFKAGTKGAETIPELLAYGDRILDVPGKRGLNAFSNTNLDGVLRSHAIIDIALAGAVISICIDSTGRAAFEKGYHVIQLSDCISGRTIVEHEFYCESVFPLYASVMNHKELLGRLGLTG